jgi:L-alanine-DL-glutamate epimerase-like enolase superfamily enzyme
MTCGARAQCDGRDRNLGSHAKGDAQSLSSRLSTALSAVDTALWDLKARVLGIPLVNLLGRVRNSVTVYGSGGFTSYDMERLTSQLAGWVDAGMSRVKMKVGRDAVRDVERVAGVRAAIGDSAELFIDANGRGRAGKRSPSPKRSSSTASHGSRNR